MNIENIDIENEYQNNIDILGDSAPTDFFVWNSTLNNFYFMRFLIQFVFSAYFEYFLIQFVFLAV